MLMTRAAQTKYTRHVRRGTAQGRLSAEEAERSSLAVFSIVVVPHPGIASRQAAHMPSITRKMDEMLGCFITGWSCALHGLS